MSDEPHNDPAQLAEDNPLVKHVRRIGDELHRAGAAEDAATLQTAADFLVRAFQRRKPVAWTDAVEQLRRGVCTCGLVESNAREHDPSCPLREPRS